MSYLPPLALSLEAALRDANSQSPPHREAAALRLWGAEEDDPRIVPTLRQLAQDPVGPVRRLGLHGLVDARDSESLSLFRTALEDPDRYVRDLGLRGLVTIEAPEAKQEVQSRLTHAEGEVRMASLGLLLDTWPADAIEASISALQDPEAEVRTAAATCLAELKAQEAADALAAVLDDESLAVMVAVSQALAHLQDSRALRPLLEALSQRGMHDETRRMSIIESLGLLGDKEAIPPLKQLADRRFGSLMERAEAGAALYRLGSDEGIGHLRAVLRAWRTYAKPHAISLVVELKLTGLRPELERLHRRRPGWHLEWALEALTE